MRIGARLEATRHLLGELALTHARQSRHYFPKQDCGATTGRGRRRCEPLLALSSKPTKFLADHHKQSICHVSRHGSNRDLNPAKTEREGFEPSSEVSPATRFPVAPVQPLRHLSSARSSRGRRAAASYPTCRSGGRRDEGYDTSAQPVARLRAMVLALSNAAVTDIGLIATFVGIGVIVNVIIVYIAIQIRGERQQNQAYREQL
jgi:hypothetical protein